MRNLPADERPWVPCHRYHDTRVPQVLTGLILFWKVRNVHRMRVLDTDSVGIIPPQELVYPNHFPHTVGVTFTSRPMGVAMDQLAGLVCPRT